MKKKIYKLVHHKIETPITVCAESPQTFAVENPDEFYDFVAELKRQFEGKEGDFILLSENDERCTLDKTGDFISDLFSLELDDKRMTTTLYKTLEKISTEGELPLLLSRLNTMVAQYYAELFDKVDLAVTFDETDTADILKAGKVRLRQDYFSLAEKIACYINAMVRLRQTDFFVFVNLKSALSDEQLRALYKHCELEKVGLLLIESSLIRKPLPEERTIIITEDLCEIVDKESAV